MNDIKLLLLQVKVVQQQEMKSYKLHSMDFKVNDPKYNDMWYIVSIH